MSKLKEMISSVTKDGANLNVKDITLKVNRRYNARISEKDVSNFLSSEFYPEEEIKHLEERHKSFDGRYYI